MVSIYDVKPQFQALLRPISDRLASRGVTANHVTLAALLLSVIIGITVYLERDHQIVLLLLPITLFIRMALNAIDGMLAREHNMKTHLGAILNEVCDVVSDTVLFLPLAAFPGFRLWLIVAVVLLSILTEFVGVLGVQIGASRRYDGPMGKSDRAFVFGALGLFLGLGLAPDGWLDAVLGILVVLLILTAINRARRALREITS